MTYIHLTYIHLTNGGLVNILQENGAQVLICATCLDYFKLKDQHKVGQVSNMYDISDVLLTAERVITI